MKYEKIEMEKLHKHSVIYTAMTIRPLNIHIAERLKSRIPYFELSYESMLHNKVPENYDVQFAIPNGKKYLLWFTFLEENNVCIIMELNKEKKPCNIQTFAIEFDERLSVGTLFYGVFLSEYNAFIIEDIHYYKGIHLKLTTGKKLVYIKEFLDSRERLSSDTIRFMLPVMKHYQGTPHNIELTYPVHHYQYRCLDKICPFLNDPLIKDKSKQENKIQRPLFIPIRPDFKKPQYKQSTVFLVSADIQFDIYHLYVYGKGGSRIYYNVAYIPDYKTSVFMNSIFRTIKENKNLDYIEESDDEDDFQNISEDKYVDLNKQISMECVFHYKFKKWVPKKIVRNAKIVHISQLTNKY